MPGCTLVILTYKGKHHLEHLLPTVETAIKEYKGNDTVDVIVVDNGCDENTKAFVNDKYPSVQYCFSPVNDYLFSLNTFIEKLATEYVFILNDDIKLDKNILNHLLPVISQDPGIFAVACKFLDWDTGASASGVRVVVNKKGWLSHRYINYDETETKYTLYASGGGGMFRTQRFNELGGFDTLFRPGYSEDTDVSIRAWQKGWTVVYHPAAFLYHREGGTMKDYFQNDSLTRTIYKNQVLFLVKNVRTSLFLFWFFMLLPYRLVTAYFSSKNQFHALLKAIPKMPEALSKRRENPPVVKDENWMAMLNTTYINGR